MARTTFSGPVRSLNGFEGTFTSTQIQLQSDNANVITMDAPAALAASYTLILPPNDGANGQVLTTDGNGVTTWTTNGAGTVTSVGGTGTVNGLTLSGSVTSSGDLTLGGSFVLPTTTAAAILDSTDAVNTTGKTIGKMLVDLSTGIIYTASGTGVNDPWGASDGSPVTPVP